MARLAVGIGIGVTAALVAAGVVALTMLPRGEDSTAPTGSAEPPGFLALQFPGIDWETADPAIFDAVSGGPRRDGIPAIDNPDFVPIADISWGDDVRAIVLDDGTNAVRVYSYNVLVWHEIVNDTVGGVPVAVTFCPLCGSASVFERTLPDGTDTTFGVSGALIESNMVMFDRATEGLWQQSTGRALAGEHVGTELALHPFQLLTLGEVRASHPGALVMSDDTGHARDYENNPYGDYDENDVFYFAPSTLDGRYPAKMIVVAFLVGEQRVAVPWLALREVGTFEAEVEGESVTLRVEGGELDVRDAGGQSLPFYFEMWFSWAVQNQESGIVLDPEAG
ncbi:DUF3179 domain-containing protein [uncultured Schumannella sp.]|jgi:hypothetical protein|uniref:DUF3179 domain-containing protein n=1 Tax=uncultured Schumannella sp. TaxID=1195956 RepID=UPI0025D45224|nr:DUF3179 domain-containing protein [uncultured Schumannella sp.]